MPAATVFGWLLVVLGVVIIVLGKFGAGPEGADDAGLHWLEGAPARWVGAGLATSGLCMMASPAVGICLLLVPCLVCWWLRR